MSTTVVAQPGSVQQVQERITLEQMTTKMGKKVSNYPNHQFYYRVYVKKSIGNQDEQKDRALMIVKDRVLRLQTHRLGIENGMSSVNRKCYVCPEKSCPWKAVLLLVGHICLSPLKERDLSMTYSGWIIFTGSSGIHIETQPDDLLIISCFEDVQELYFGHYLQKFNLIALLCQDDESVYNVQEVKSQRAEKPNLKYGLMQIWEIKQIVRMLYTEDSVKDPIYTMDQIIKFIQDIQKNMIEDESGSAQKYFHRAIKDVFNNMQIEGRHQQFSSRAEEDSVKPVITINWLTRDSKIEDKSYTLELDVWNQSLQENYLSSTWKQFCKVASMTSEQFQLPWIQPSLDFSCESKIKMSKKLSKENAEKIKSLKENTFRNGRKETPQDEKLENIYQSIANIMDLDVSKGKADFSTVSVVLLAEKKKQLVSISEAQKEVNDLQERYDDIELRLRLAKQSIKAKELLLARNDQLSKQWIKLAPTVIAVALKSQNVKVEQVNTCLGESAQQDRIKDETNFQNQFGQAKSKCLTKLEQQPLTQSTASESQSSKSITPQDKRASKKIKKESKSRSKQSRKKKVRQSELMKFVKMNYSGLIKQFKTNQSEDSIIQDGDSSSEETQTNVETKVENEQDPAYIERQTQIAEKLLSQYKYQESPRAKFDSMLHNPNNQEMEI